MNFFDWLGLTPEQVSHGFYGLVGWAAASVTVRPKGLVEATVSMCVAVVFAEAAADGVAGIIARVFGGGVDTWVKPAALIVGFGGISLLQVILNRLAKMGEGKTNGHTG